MTLGNIWEKKIPLSKEVSLKASFRLKLMLYRTDSQVSEKVTAGGMGEPAIARLARRDNRNHPPSLEKFPLCLGGENIRRSLKYIFLISSWARAGR